MIFKEYFLKKKVQGVIKRNNARKQRFYTLEEARDILVLYRGEDELVARTFVDRLRAMKKKVTVCIYTRTESGLGMKNIIYVHALQDVTRLGIPTDVKCEELNKFPADILIDLTRSDDLVLQYLVLQHPATFKVGWRHKGESIYDFSLIIDRNSSLTDMTESLLFYLQSICFKR